MNLDDAVKELENEDNQDEAVIESEDDVSEDLIGLDENIENDKDEFENDESDSEEEAEDDVIDIDGESVNIGDLKQTYQEYKQYKDDIENVALQKSDYVTKLQSVDEAMNNIIEYVASFVPPAPALKQFQSIEELNEYNTAVSVREKIISELQQIMTLKGVGESKAQEINQADFARFVESEEKKLYDIVPEIKTEAGKKEFYQNVLKTGLDFGFLESEIKGIADSRLLKTLHFARIGKRSAEKMKNALNAQSRISAKPVSGTGKFITAQNVQDSSYKQNLKKFTQSGSLEDAIKLL